MAHMNASLERPAAWYKKVNITSGPLARSFFPKHPELLSQFNSLVQNMNDEITHVENTHNNKITNFIAVHQDALAEYARTTFIEEQIAAKEVKTVASAKFDASDAILRAFHAKRAAEITKMKACRDACNIAPENLKHLSMMLHLLKEGDDLDDIVFG